MLRILTKRNQGNSVRSILILEQPEGHDGFAKLSFYLTTGTTSDSRRSMLTRNLTMKFYMTMTNFENVIHKMKLLFFYFEVNIEK